MKTTVIDASVAVKWLIPEPGAEAARPLLDGSHELIAPDLLWIEVTQVVWKLARRKLLTTEQAALMVQDFAHMPVECYESAPLLRDAMDLALAHDRTVYDSLYLALAASRDAILVTADLRLENSMRTSPLAKRILLLGAEQSDTRP